MTRKLINIFNVFFAIHFLVEFIKYLFGGKEYGYLKQSNFIDYSQGFIRRGLFGELVKFVDYMGINTFLFIKIFSLLCFLLVILYMVRKFKENNFSYDFLFLPYTIVYSFLGGFVEFKDYFLILLFIIIIKTSLLNIKPLYKYLIYNIIIILGTLIHEIFFFLSVPILLILLSFNITDSIKNILFQSVKSICFLFPTILTLFIVIYFHGTPEMANKIYLNSLNYLPKDAEVIGIRGGISSLGENAKTQLSYMFRELIWNGFSRGITYIIFLITLIYIFYNFSHFKASKIRGGGRKHQICLY